MYYVFGLNKCNFFILRCLSSY